MPVRSLSRRIDRIRLQSAPEPVGRIAVIYPESWADEDRIAYYAAEAAHNWALQADIVERVTGERPVFPFPNWRPGNPPAIIEIITHPYGP